MKKVFAILLTCVMLLTCVPFSASAAEVVANGAETVSVPFSVNAGDTYIVTGTYTIATTMTIMEGASLVVEEGGSIIFTGESGRLINSGSVTVKRNGTLALNGIGTGAQGATFINNEKGVFTLDNGSMCTLSKNSQGFNYGNIKNIDRMDVKGTLTHQVTIPGSFNVDYSYVETWNRLSFNTSYYVSYYIPKEGDADLDYTEDSSYTLINADTTVPVIHGQKLYVMITPEEGSEGDWADVGRMQLIAGGQNVAATEHEKIDNDRGVFCISPANALELGVYSTSYKDLVKLFEINLPRTEAYYVISKDGDVDEITVEYGKTFSFRVVLSPDYDKSDYYCYVNTLYMEPDEFGYYDVTGPIVDEGMATDGGVQEDITIQVMGVAANARQEMVGSLVGFIQEIFSVFKEIFSYFTSIFEGLGNLGA